MFAKAKTVATVAPTKAKAKTTTADKIAGFDQLAAIDACIKALDGLKKLVSDTVTPAMRGHLIADGIRHKDKPGSRKVTESLATGTYYIRKRDTRSPLSQDDLALIAELGEVKRDEDGNIIEVAGFTTATEVQPALLAVNPAYASDVGLLERLDAAIQKSKLDLPDDFIIQQPATVKITVSDDALANLFRKHSEGEEAGAVIGAALDVLSGITAKPVFSDIAKAWEIVQPLMTGEYPEAQSAEVVEINRDRAAA